MGGGGQIDGCLAAGCHDGKPSVCLVVGGGEGSAGPTVLAVPIPGGLPRARLRSQGKVTGWRPALSASLEPRTPAETRGVELGFVSGCLSEAPPHPPPPVCLQRWSGRALSKTMRRCVGGTVGWRGADIFEQMVFFLVFFRSELYLVSEEQ